MVRLRYITYTCWLLGALCALPLNALALSKVSLQLNWSYQFEFAGFIMAKELGYYKQVGLDVDIREFKLGTSVNAVVGSDQAEYGVTNPGALVAYSLTQGTSQSHSHFTAAPVKVIAAIMQHQMYVLAVPESSPLHRISDLQGKLIGMDDSEMNSTLLAAMGQAGLDSGSYTLTQNKIKVINGVAKGADAFAVFLSNEIYQGALFGEPLRVILNPVDVGYDFYEDILIASEKELKQRPERARLFMEASLKGWQYALDHVDETIQILFAKYNTQQKRREALQYEARVLAPVIRSSIVDIGYMSKSRWLEIAEAYQQHGLISQKIDINHLVEQFVYEPPVGLVSFVKENPSLLIVFLVMMLLIGWFYTNWLSRHLKKSRKELAVQLKQAESVHERYLSLLQVIPDAVMVYSLEGKILYVNERCARILGYINKRDLIGRNIKDCVHPDEVEALLARKEALAAGEAVQYPVETRVLTAQFTELLVEVYASLSTWSEEKAVQVCFRDITQRKRGEEALRISEERFRRLIDIMPYLIAVYRDGRWVYANRTAREFFGATRDEDVLGKEVLGFVHPEDRERVLRRMQLYQVESSTSTAATNTEIKLLTLNGNLTHADITEIRMNYDGSPATMMVGRDINEEKQLRVQAQRAQKMETMGAMVGGIAHDFNNMLAGISGTAFLAKDSAKDDPELLKAFETIEELTLHGADVVSQLMAFARKDTARKGKQNFAACVNKAFSLVRTSVSESIQLNLQVEEADMQVECDETQIQQVLFNLVSNAKHALENRRRPAITIELNQVRGRDIQDVTGIDRSRFYAHLSVQDNGVGMTQGQMERMYDPFFTTKDIGEGTGLGLSMVYGVVQSHQGIILGESEQGKGTVFHIYLPIQVEKKVLETKVLSPGEIAEGSGQTILVVEDDDSIRKTSRQLLERLGYQVLEAVDGMDAIAQFERHQNQIDLILSDVVMPRLGGVEAIQHIREMSPTIPVMFVTGYDREDSLQNLPHCTVLRKPYDVITLSQKVREELSGAA